MNLALVRGAPLFWAILAVSGLCLGSFLNVVIHRLPRGESLLHPRSRCPRCGRAIAPWDNVPLLSFLLLRGRCRHCRGPIGIRYPVVEILGAACLLLAVSGSREIGPALVRALFLLAMVAVLWIDLDHRIIPDRISIPGIALGILASPLLGVPRLEALVGAAAGAGALLAVGGAYRIVRGIEGMGMGDVKLAGMIGAFMGWKGLLLTLVLGSLCGALLGTVLVLVGRADGRTALPYGTFLAPAASLVLLAGPRIWAWYSHLLGGTGPGCW